MRITNGELLDDLEGNDYPCGCMSTASSCETILMMLRRRKVASEVLDAEVVKICLVRGRGALVSAAFVVK
jgi:hypothetical protein